MSELCWFRPPAIPHCSGREKGGKIHIAFFFLISKASTCEATTADTRFQSATLGITYLPSLDCATISPNQMQQSIISPISPPANKEEANTLKSLVTFLVMDYIQVWVTLSSWICIILNRSFPNYIMTCMSTFCLVQNKIKQVYVSHFAISSSGDPKVYSYIHPGLLARILCRIISFWVRWRIKKEVDGGKTSFFVEMPQYATTLEVYA